jgi:hypothetical protein
VSDLLTSPPDGDEDGSRGRAVWGLVALAIIAALIVVIMLATTGGSGGHHGAANTTVSSQLPSEPPSTPTTTPTTSAAPSTSASSSASPSAVPTSTGNPCGAAKSCAVPGDAGQLVAAVNAFRTAHGRAAVTGTATPQAQQCAASLGDGPTCAPSYAWEPVATQNGPKAVALVSPQWLLDPAMKSFQVGWAYADGQWECAILKLR